MRAKPSASMKPASILLAIVLACPGAFTSAAPIELDRIVAVVNSEAITATELTTEMDILRQQLRRADIDTATLRKQALERLILRHIQLQLARDNNIVVDDDTLNRTINQIAAQNNLSLTEFREALHRDGYEFERFRQDVRDEIIMTRLRQRMVDSRVTVTEAEVDQRLAAQRKNGGNEEFRLAHLVVEVPENATAAEQQSARSQAEQLLAQLQQGAPLEDLVGSGGAFTVSGGDLGWRKGNQLPTLFIGAVTSLKPGEIAPLLRSPNGFHIIKLLERRGNDHLVVTQIHARHILIRTNVLIDDAAAQARLETLRAELAKGADFAELARKYSDDKVSAAKGGDLGWSGPGDMVPAFEDMMNQTEPGAISPPFKSSFGWHILQVLEKREQDVTEQIARNAVRKQLIDRRSAEEQEAWLRRMRDEAYVDIRPTTP